MKLPLPALLALCCAPLAAQQTPRPQDSTKTKLPTETVGKVLKTLEQLEETILNQRNSTLGAVIAKLAEASGSNQAAAKFFADCDLLVNAERKDMSKAEARARAEQVERSLEQQRNKKGGGSANGNEETGDPALGIRLGLRYLMLTLEAHETKDEDFEKMVPKLQAYLQDLVAAAPQLKGRAFGMVQRSAGAASPVVEAYQLKSYLKRDQWSSDPAQIGPMYEQTLFKAAKPEQLAGLWDLRLQQEAAWIKGLRSEAEHTLWLQQELPTLRWSRGLSLYEATPDTVNALASLLKVIQEFPAHPNAPEWVSTLRKLINESAEVPVSEAAAKP